MYIQKLYMYYILLHSHNYYIKRPEVRIFYNMVSVKMKIILNILNNNFNEAIHKIFDK